jgi:hypothetical protein
MPDEITIKIGAEAHSERRLVTGLAMAALIAWKLTVIRAMVRISKPASVNTHQLILIL